MDVRKRLILRFIAQLVTIGFLILLLVGGAVSYFFNEITRIEMNQDFTNAGMTKLVDSIRTENERITFDSKLLDQALRQGGWLQVLDDDGSVTHSYGVPADVPDRYLPGEFVDYWSGRKPFPYALYLWIEEKNGNTYTLLYGKRSIERILVEEVSRSAALAGEADKAPKAGSGAAGANEEAKEEDEGTEALTKASKDEPMEAGARDGTSVYEDGQLHLPQPLQQKLIAAGAAVQLLSPEGEERAAFRKPPDLPSAYSLQDLALRSQHSERYGYDLASLSEADGRTWVVSVPQRSDSTGTFPETVPQAAVAAFLGLFAGMLLLLVGAAFWYGHRFGTPMLHILAWLRRISRSSYDEPASSGGQPRSRRKDGRLKKRFRLYSDVMQTLQQLSEALRQSEEARAQLERTRDEWIAGISHDLRTPLASIKGYAHMLEAPQYTWTETEIKEFAAIIKDKADFMEQLAGDLSLTFRLKNGGQPFVPEQTELNEFVRRSILQVINDPEFADANVTFEPAAALVAYPIDRQAFRRVLDNLVANAIRHNPPATPVEVKLTGAPGGGFVLDIRDNGIGMDEETLEKLFDRYYRGTHTEGETRGTGLGMAIARQLVIQQAGRIEASSEPGRGTLVRLTFGPPAAKDCS
ncbi:HAMP domain-containing sensor histidine kinase [Paenibacillus sp. FJAT-26967]|uniref:sensor histidine kinase n=1 Tax=Paenibacillus sp. FJAT-26967 TaxID=1729690 RepID=UPI000837F9C9|nr:HAMP domain-containing sensor histidine kinase [Paenibacillus sp. FJAT-26967]